MHGSIAERGTLSRLSRVFTSVPFRAWAWSAVALGALGPGTSEAIICEELLTPVQIEVLNRAERGGYFVYQMTATVGGIARKVIFLGENHAPDPSVSRLGTEVRQEFPHQAVEGLNSANYLAGSLLERSAGEPLRAALKKNSFSPAVLSALAPLVQQVEEGLAAAIVEEIRAGTKTLASVRESVASGAIGQDNGAPMGMEILIRSVDLAKVLKSVETAIAEDPGSASAPLALVEKPKPRAPVQLEAGHRPSFTENLGGIMNGLGHLGRSALFKPVCMIGGACATLITFAAFSHPVAATAPILFYAGATAVTAVTEMLGHQLLAHRGRNETIAQAILETFRASASEPVQVLLVMVGAAHLPPLVDLLEKAGFQ
jgi:hypothetical protein